VTDAGHSYDNRADGEQRRGNWMQTYTGRQFWPIDPRPEEVDLDDIAHALANACRFAGHCESFYSVAEHSLLVSLVVPPEHALTALLHDATEAYLVDIPRPLKPYLPGYKELEARVWDAIAQKFELPREMPPCVKDADSALLLAEQQQIMKPAPAPWCVPGDPAKVFIAGWSPSLAAQMFHLRFKQVTTGGPDIAGFSALVLP